MNPSDAHDQMPNVRANLYDMLNQLVEQGKKNLPAAVQNLTPDELDRWLYTESMERDQCSDPEERWPYQERTLQALALRWAKSRKVYRVSSFLMHEFELCQNTSILEVQNILGLTEPIFIEVNLVCEDTDPEGTRRMMMIQGVLLHVLTSDTGTIINMFRIAYAGEEQHIFADHGLFAQSAKEALMVEHEPGHQPRWHDLATDIALTTAAYICSEDADIEVLGQHPSGVQVHLLGDDRGTLGMFWALDTLNRAGGWAAIGSPASMQPINPGHISPALQGKGPFWGRKQEQNRTRIRFIHSSITGP